jgi:hypothetical protein
VAVRAGHFFTPSRTPRSKKRGVVTMNGASQITVFPVTSFSFVSQCVARFRHMASHL